MPNYLGLTINASSPGSTDVYAGAGLCLFVAKTGSTASAAVTYVNSATTDKWLIPLNPGANTLWFPSSSTVPYIAYYVVRPEGYSGPSTLQLSATTKTIAVSGSWSYKCPTQSFIADLWADRQMSTTSWLADISSFTSYEDMNIIPGADLVNYQMYYGTGTTAWTTSQIGSRYPCCARLGFKSPWSNGFLTYYTEKPAENTGYTITMSSMTTVRMMNSITNSGGGYMHIMNLDIKYVDTYDGGTGTMTSLDTQDQIVSNGGWSYLSVSNTISSKTLCEKLRIYFYWYFDTSTPTNSYYFTFTWSPSSGGLSTKTTSNYSGTGGSIDLEWTLTANVSPLQLAIQAFNVG